MILDGIKISQEIQNKLKPRIDYLIKNNNRPGLGIILIGENIESTTYINMKQKNYIIIVISH